MRINNLINFFSLLTSASGIIISQEMVNQIREDGSYQIIDGKLINQVKNEGFFVAIRKFDEKDDFDNKNEFLGIWHDKKKNNEKHLDVSILMLDQKQAEKLGMGLKEKAIWDCKRNEEIWLNNCLIPINFFEIFHCLVEEERIEKISSWQVQKILSQHYQSKIEISIKK